MIEVEKWKNVLRNYFYLLRFATLRNSFFLEGEVKMDTKKK